MENKILRSPFCSPLGGNQASSPKIAPPYVSPLCGGTPDLIYTLFIFETNNFLAGPSSQMLN